MMNDSQLNQSTIKYDYDSDDTEKKYLNQNINKTKTKNLDGVESCESRDHLSEDLNDRE